MLLVDSLPSCSNTLFVMLKCSGFTCCFHSLAVACQCHFLIKACQLHRDCLYFRTNITCHVSDSTVSFRQLYRLTDLNNLATDWEITDNIGCIWRWCCITNTVTGMWPKIFLLEWQWWLVLIRAAFLAENATAYCATVGSQGRWSESWIF